MNSTAGARRARLLRRSSLPLLALALAGVLAGCGGSSKSSSTTASAPAAAAPETTSAPASSSSTPAAPATASSALSLEANKEGQLKYDTTTLSAKAGAVTIDFKNSSELAHNVTVESSSGSSVGATPTFAGGSKTLSLQLKPGTYKFFCSVPGHRQAGMEGTLTVQ